MADDGLFINFDSAAALGGKAYAPAVKLRGGRWRDRLAAKRAASGTTGSARDDGSGRGPTAVNANVVGEKGRPFHVTAVDDDGLPAKRRRVEQAGRRTYAADAGPRQVVSSLFTYNPKSTAQASAVEADTANADPSNAPVDDGILDPFVSLGTSPSLALHLRDKMGIAAPTAVQIEAIPKLLSSDSDAFLQAETGSGKTLAYLLPLVQRINALTNSETPIQRSSGLFAIILAPTRELSRQIATVLESLLRATRGLVAGIVIGGEKKKSEKARLRKGVNILVATPGRLADHLDHTKVLDVSTVRWLVLDEGDRLVELGFEKDIQKIVSTLNVRRSKISALGLPEARINILCSATIKTDVQRLGEISLKDAIHIKAASGPKADGEAKGDHSEFAAPAQLRQSYAVVPAKLRLVTLQALLKQSFARKGAVKKAMVFISCADSVDFHFDVLARGAGGEDDKDDSDPTRTSAEAPGLSPPEGDKVWLYRLHGSLSQALRTQTLAAYTRSTNPAVLVCTDVASRGLDLPSVDLVVEYDPPFSADDHLHRVGRTARAGRPGRALIFLLPGSEEAYVELVLTAAGRHATRHDANELLKKGLGAAWENVATEHQLAVERWALAHPGALERARRAFQSHVRAYATHVAAERHAFDLGALHLGHLAKAFGLRDKPSGMRVPGQRPEGVAGAGDKRGVRRPAGPGAAAAPAEGQAPVGDAGADEIRAAARKMRSLARNRAQGVSEFNLG